MAEKNDLAVDDDEHREFAALAGMHRRRLLETAASGFVLAAGGLLLPADLVENAEARQTPVRRMQHRKEQRQRKRRNERQRKRGNKKNRDGDGRGFLRNIAFSVVNNTWGDLVLGMGGGFDSIHSQTFQARKTRRMEIDNDEAFVFFPNGPLVNESYAGRLLEINNPNLGEVWYWYWTIGFFYPNGTHTSQDGYTTFVTGVSPTDSVTILAGRFADFNWGFVEFPPCSSER